MFHLGDEPLSEVQEYQHVGIMNRVIDSAPLQWILSNIGKCRRAFYSTIGTSLHKTLLSPLSLSKVYNEICIPKLIYGSEIHHFCDLELDMYEQFHRDMAKDIQQLPTNCPNPVLLAMIGRKKIEYMIDLSKLSFGHRIVSSLSDSTYRNVFVNRFCFILYNLIFTYMSPVAQFVTTCKKYNLLDDVKQWL